MCVLTIGQPSWFTNTHNILSKYVEIKLNKKNIIINGTEYNDYWRCRRIYRHSYNYRADVQEGGL
jgi:hypothetical protein